jgi:hypothetical protein
VAAQSFPHAVLEPSDPLPLKVVEAKTAASTRHMAAATAAGIFTTFVVPVQRACGEGEM